MGGWMRRVRNSTLVLAAALLAGLLPTAAVVADDLPVSTVQVSVSGTLQEHHQILLQADVSSSAGDVATDGTVTFTRDGGGGPDCNAVPFVNGNDAVCTFDTLPPGSYTYTAAYSGNASSAPQTSDPFTFEVTADTLDASGVGRNYATFYPVKDSYKDTLTILGTRLESISVSIKIYNASNHLVRSTSVAGAMGGYAVKWNGRTASGTLLASGRYRIVQKLTDGSGTSSTFTSYANLSHKKLVFKTVYLTKAGIKAHAVGTYGGATALTRRGASWVRLRASASAGQEAILGYAFTLPKATVYKSLSFQASTNSKHGSPTNTVSMQDFHFCAYQATGTWDINCFSKFADIGSTSGSRHWSKTTSTSSGYRSGLHARGSIDVHHGTVYVYSVRLKVTYGVLR
jgi:Bacterial Ig-like domain (group 3)/FlgD Ig-like domain